MKCDTMDAAFERWAAEERTWFREVTENDRIVFVAGYKAGVRAMVASGECEPAPPALAEHNRKTRQLAAKIEATALRTTLAKLVDGCEKQVGGFDALDELDEAKRILAETT